MVNKYKQRPDGRFATNVWDGTYKNGSKHYKTLYAETSKDLERLVYEFEHKVKMGEFTTTTPVTIYEYSKTWLEESKNLKEKSTQQMYENVIKYHLKRFNISFEHFTLKNIQGLIDNNRDKPRTCQQIAMTLKQIGKSAEYEKLLIRGTTDEIFARLNLPKYEAKEKRALTDEEIHTFKTHIWTCRQRLFLGVVYYCGLRREEALALTWRDVEGDYIVVNKAHGFYGSTPYLKKPKSKNGNRKVPIPSELKIIIQECKAEMPENELLFVMQDGRPMTKDSYISFWRTISKVFGTDITAHIFRHNYCTRLCYASLKDNSITLKKIAELMGDNLNMVNEVYSHVLDEKEDTLKAIESAF